MRMDSGWQGTARAGGEASHLSHLEEHGSKGNNQTNLSACLHYTFWLYYNIFGGIKKKCVVLIVLFMGIRVAWGPKW